MHLLHVCEYIHTYLKRCKDAHAHKVYVHNRFYLLLYSIYMQVFCTQKHTRLYLLSFIMHIYGIERLFHWALKMSIILMCKIYKSPLIHILQSETKSLYFIYFIKTFLWHDKCMHWDNSLERIELRHFTCVSFTVIH